MRKRKTLPKDFAELLDSAPLERLQAVFDACEIEATGGYGKLTALGFDNCPAELARWLVAQGADIDRPDTYGRTPLHQRAALGRDGIDMLLDLGASIEARDDEERTPLHAAAEGQRTETTRALIERGADVHALDDDDQTPLALALATTRNADIERTAVVAELLLAAGARVDDAMRDEVRRIGKEFEFHRANFNAEDLPATDAGLATLHRLFGVTPPGPRRVHDGVAPIEVAATRWPEQHEELWQLLVPSQGAARTVQGEAIRITGRVSNELLGNGGANWDAGYRAMLDALLMHLAAGVALPAAELGEAKALAAALRSGEGEDEGVHRLAELAVRWVLANPAPIPLAPPAYRR